MAAPVPRVVPPRRRSPNKMERTLDMDSLLLAAPADAPVSGPSDPGWRDYYPGVARVISDSESEFEILEMDPVEEGMGNDDEKREKVEDNQLGEIGGEDRVELEAGKEKEQIVIEEVTMEKEPGQRGRFVLKLDEEIQRMKEKEQGKEKEDKKEQGFEKERETKQEKNTLEAETMKEGLGKRRTLKRLLSDREKRMARATELGRGTSSFLFPASTNARGQRSSTVTPGGRSPTQTWSACVSSRRRRSSG